MNKHGQERSRRSPKFAPKLEGMEKRELLSYTAVVGGYAKAMAAVNAAFARAQSNSAQAQAAASTSTFNPPASPKGTPLQTSIDFALSQFQKINGLTPTQHEIARETIVSKFQSEYIVGPPRFTNQSFQIAIKGAGGSNQSFHMNVQMAVFMPKTPGEPITGVAALMPKNIAETGSVAVLDLVGDPNSLFHGLPTHFTWTSDSNSGGVYLFGGGAGTGYGTLDIHYSPSGKLRQRATGGGNATVVVQGLINTGGVFSPIQVVGAH
jgi:hypothetical protein